MTPVRRAAGAVAVAVLAPAMLLTAGSSAQAAEEGSAAAEPAGQAGAVSAGAGIDCPDGYICFTDGRNGEGDFLKYRDPGPHDFPPEFRNRMSAYENNTGTCVKAYDWVDWGLDYAVLLGNATTGPLDHKHDAGGTFENRLDSIDIGGCP